MDTIAPRTPQDVHETPAFPVRHRGRHRGRRIGLIVLGVLVLLVVALILAWDCNWLR